MFDFAKNGTIPEPVMRKILSRKFAQEVSHLGIIYHIVSLSLIRHISFVFILSSVTIHIPFLSFHISFVNFHHGTMNTTPVVALLGKAKILRAYGSAPFPKALHLPAFLQVMSHFTCYDRRTR